MNVLIGVELRKAVDTRAGRWLLIVIGVLACLVVVLQVTFGGADLRTSEAVLASAQQPVSLLTPVLGLLLVTGEWSQRTTLTTFALVPVRERVVTAKVAAALLLSLVTTAFGFAAALAGIGVGVALDRVTGEVPVAVLAQLTLVNGVITLFGTFFGLLLRQSAPALVVYFAVPFAWTIVGRIVPGLESVSPWLDVGQARAPLAESAVSVAEWGRFATSAALWVALPALVGTLRLRRADLV